MIKIITTTDFSPWNTMILITKMMSHARVARLHFHSALCNHPAFQRSPGNLHKATRIGHRCLYFLSHSISEWITNIGRSFCPPTPKNKNMKDLRREGRRRRRRRKWSCMELKSSFCVERGWDAPVASHDAARLRAHLHNNWLFLAVW